MLHLENDIRILENCRADYLHMDIMDGEFVPNYTLGTDLIKTLHAFCSIPQDIHLMISHPEKKLERFDITAGNCVSFHYEACCDIPFCIDYIKSKGAKPILAINPNTDVSVTAPYLSQLFGVLVMTVYPGYAGQKLVDSSLEKITAMRLLAEQSGLSELHVQVDGNVSFQNGTLMKKHGADMFVCGSSSLFTKEMTIKEAYEKFAQCIR